MHRTPDNSLQAADAPAAATAKPPVGVLDRGLLLLHLFTLERNRMYLRELSELSALDKATTLRALRSLVEWGFLERHADGSYSPGAMNLRLAAIFKETSSLVTRAERLLNAIADRVGQSVSFFVLAGEQRICMGRSRKKSSHSSYVELGSSVPLSQGGSAAKLLLAYAGDSDAASAAIRQQGHIISRGERLRHFTSVSLPLFEVDGSFLGAVVIAGLSSEITDLDLLAMAEAAGEEMAKQGFPRSAVTASGSARVKLG
jgi:DNA-binding IclR family transcriptional regulator